ncbi:MAG: Lrp/AsnC family transcriptional regulator [Anaerolineae bacterium]|nr:Lrp/AsnC family transcriptional regulator [Anaerolineae bacterium]
MKESAQERPLDAIDRALLQELQTNSRISNVELAQRVELSPPAVHTRVKRLEQLGFITHYTAILDRQKLGLDMLCFIRLTLASHDLRSIENFRAAILAMPEVLEAYFLTGEYDYMLKVMVQNRQHLETFLLERITPMPGIARINTSLVLTELKQTTEISLDDLAPPDSPHG